ncbi:lysoplasmalogenase [Leptospira meyeri]|uniref:lysoplasmalogenase n=1 Tax=Leptospira meyeri TaxID=29508 RepID=UPI0010839032|nr:lysoplasmalogenase [Leptospira meyeri]MCW7488831.1 lysoplasmalogenase [Leptospira meyeri]TGM64451.1 lysoplasmalogenase [Leptospira meyeri]TGM67080.1 lysoplasmalogenase [Leptospira meyeri]
MEQNLILIATLPLLAGLLYFEKKESIKGLLSVKPVLSALFVVTAFLQIQEYSIYHSLILSGLILSLIGDICLIFFFHKKVFAAGLGAFLTGHVMYTIAFSQLGKIGWIMAAIGSICILISITIFIKLKSSLGNMKVPVMGYIVIITAMVLGASSFWEQTTLNITGRKLVLGGAILFYISDIFVARHRFVHKEFLNRAIGLPMYYTAQFMIAFSSGYL